jgi:hypothetical protein
MSNPAQNSRAATLAKEILDDLRGAAFYGDPEVLAPMLRTGADVTPADVRNAVEVIRGLLRLYATGTPPDRAETKLAEHLERVGVR